MKRYVYFISATFDGQPGNGDAWTEGGPISSLGQIREIEASIAEKTGATQVILTNYILMRTEKVK